MKLIRPPRTLTVEYRPDGTYWWTATSPDLADFRITAPDLPQVKKLARDRLAAWLDPAVHVREITLP